MFLLFHYINIVPCLLVIHVCLQARAVRNLWVGGIGPSVSKQELEEEFQKFGKIEGVAFSRDQLISRGPGAERYVSVIVD